MLGGSRKFPVREPFFEMVKMSMATFINAFTAQTFTSYPIATNVHKDFFNLVDVYLDAVFHPGITRQTLQTLLKMTPDFPGAEALLESLKKTP